MTKLHLHVRVKFRAFGITFGQFERHVERLLPVLLPGIAYQVIYINERGVFVSLTQEPLQQEADL